LGDSFKSGNSRETCYLCRVVKKAFIAILALLYLAIASGVEMNIHYCMGEIASVEYSKSEKGLCGKCGMESKKGCCEDETTLLKIQDSHQSSQLSWAFQLPLAELTVSPEFLNFLAYNSKSYKNQPAHGPPPGPNVPIYIKNRVFRI
jgi:hypothetical protein